MAFMGKVWCENRKPSRSGEGFAIAGAERLQCALYGFEQGAGFFVARGLAVRGLHDGDAVAALVGEADEVARCVVRVLGFFVAPQARPEAGLLDFFGALRQVLHLVGAAFVVLFFEGEARLVKADAEYAPCLRR